jgi:hypothetical protein
LRAALSFGDCFEPCICHAGILFDDAEANLSETALLGDNQVWIHHLFAWKANV